MNQHKKMHVGKKVKELVKSKRLTNEEFAKIVDKHPKYVYQIFKQENINTELLQVIAAYFGVGMSYFFDENDNNQVNENSEQYGLSIHEKYIKSLEHEIKRLNSELEEYRK